MADFACWSTSLPHFHLQSGNLDFFVHRSAQPPAYAIICAAKSNHVFIFGDHFQKAQPHTSMSMKQICTVTKIAGVIELGRNDTCCNFNGQRCWYNVLQVLLAARSLFCWLWCGSQLRLAQQTASTKKRYQHYPGFVTTIGWSACLMPARCSNMENKVPIKLMCLNCLKPWPRIYHFTANVFKQIVVRLHGPYVICLKHGKGHASH